MKLTYYQARNMRLRVETLERLTTAQLLKLVRHPEMTTEQAIQHFMRAKYGKEAADEYLQNKEKYNP